MKISSPGLSLASATPTAETNGVAGAVGTGLLAARSDHVHGIFTAAALVAENTTEQTTTSTNSVDLVTLPATNIPTTSDILIVGQYRKTAAAEGGGQTPGLGLKINGTVIAVPPDMAFLSTVNRAEDGTFVFVISKRDVNYLCGVFSEYFTQVSATNAQAQTRAFGGPNTTPNPLPNAAITAIVITARSDTATSPTIGVKNVKVYELP